MKKRFLNLLQVKKFYSLVSSEFLVAVDDIISQTHRSTQGNLFGAEEGHRLESFDAILRLPLTKVPGEVIVDPTSQRE